MTVNQPLAMLLNASQAFIKGLWSNVRSNLTIIFDDLPSRGRRLIKTQSHWSGLVTILFLFHVCFLQLCAQPMNPQFE
jgi:hypothetical protein